MMNGYLYRTLKWLTLAAVPILLATQAHAQATRTWVSGVGDDANPCSRTAPCKTFAGAISKTAAGGEINALDPGGYGGVTITKAITINGDGTLAGVLVAGTNGIVVNAGGSDVVTLRNLDIFGTGSGINGISFLNGGALHLEKVQVYGFTGQGLLFQPPGTTALFITESSFRNNAGGGVHIAPAGGGIANANLNGVSLLGNGRGLRAQDGAGVVVRNSVAAGNSGNGFIAIGSTGGVDMTIESSVSANNGAAGVFAGSLATIRISNVNVVRNSVGLLLSGGQIASSGNNTVQGNVSNGAPSSTPGQI